MRVPYTRQEVIDVIERKLGGAVPLVFHKWWGNGLEERYGQALYDCAEKYPDDIFTAFYTPPGEDRSYNANPSYRWGYRNYDSEQSHGIAQQKELLTDWNGLDRLFGDFPDPDEADSFDVVKKSLPLAGGRYKLGCWWHFLHERMWLIRGMENLMVDYYENMDSLKMLGSRLIEYYKRIVDRYAALGFDGIFTSDDLGHQTGPMMSPEIFRELYLPLYSDLIAYVHGKGMHFFLHSCGDNAKLMEDLIAAGVDVFHPIQTGCMDLEETASRFGGRISFLAGMDVQHLIPNGTSDEVSEGVRTLVRTLRRRDGGLLLAAGNGILADTPLENIDTMLAEMTNAANI